MKSCTLQISNKSDYRKKRNVSSHFFFFFYTSLKFAIKNYPNPKLPTTNYSLLIFFATFV